MEITTKIKIIKAFNINSISPEQVAIGCGKAIANGKRYSIRAGVTYKQDNAIAYIVKYITDKNICIVWKKSGRNHAGMIIPRNVFSVKADTVNALYEGGIVTKGIEFVNRYQEKVLICSPDCLQECLKNWLI